MKRRPTALREKARAEDGQGLIELLIALVILAVAIGALLTVMTASAVGLQRSDEKGTALTIAEAHIELYRNLTYSGVRLDQASLPVTPATDAYNTAWKTDSTIPNPAAAPGQVTDTAAGTDPCPDPGPPPECKPVQTVVGPDNRQYRVDTYITPYTPTNGSTIRQVTVVVRDLTVPGLRILARNTSTFSPINAASAKSLPRLTASGPTYAVLSDPVPVPKASIDAALTGAQSPTGTITFFVDGPRATAPSTCVGAGWSQVGTATVNGNGAYSSDGDYTPASTGSYWWYASYSGDNGNNPVNSTCGAGMAPTQVIATKAHPVITVSAPATGFTNTAIPVSAIISSAAAANGQIVVTVFGPSPTAPASCASGGTTVGTPINGNGNGTYPMSPDYTTTVVGKYWWYASFAGDTTDFSATSACPPLTETDVTVPPDTFGLSAIGGQTAGTSFGFSLTANLPAGGIDTAYTGAHCITFSDPSNSPNSSAPTYPATGSCAAGESSISFTSGVASSFSTTLVDAQTTTLTAKDTHGPNGTITGQSNSFTVVAGPTSAFVLTNPGAQTAGAQFNVAVTSYDTWGNQSNDNSTYTVSWSGANQSPNNTGPTYAPTSLGFVAGNASAAGFKFYNAAGTTLKMTQGGSNYTTTFAVNAGPTASISLTNPGAQVAGTSFGVTISATDTWQNPETGTHTITWSGAANSPNASTPTYGSSSVNFAAGSAIVSGFTMVNAASTTLKATEAATNGTTTFGVSAAKISLTWSCPPSSVQKKKTYTETVTRGKDPYGNADPNLSSAIIVSFSQTGGVTIPANITIAANTTSNTSANFTNPNNSGVNVTITAHTANSGYTDATCAYTTT